MSLEKQLATLSVLAAIAGTSHAADETPIVVTATRTAQVADQALAPVIVIDRATIERTAAIDVADLLRFHAGIDIGRNGGPGQPASVFMRGTDSNHTLVMVDGVKINPGTIGGAALQNIAPDLIQRIEIVKGPRSSLYGSEAIGGVINIITRRAHDGAQGRFGVGVGSFDTRRFNVGAGYGRADARIGFDASALTTGGFPARVESGIDSGHRNLSLNTYAGRRLGAFDVDVSHWQARGNTEYFNFLLAPLDQDFKNSASALSLKTSPRDAWTSTLRLSQVVDEIEQNQSSDYAHTRRNQLDWQNDVQLDERQLLTAGLWASHERTDSRVFGSGFNVTTDVTALFVQDDITLGAHRVLLAARHTEHEGFGGHATWDAEYGYQWTPRTRLTAAVGTGFRAPDATDRFGFGGNPSLAPETSRNIELGVRHALNARQTLTLNAFDNRIKDLVTFSDPDGFFGPLPGANQNVERARIRGVELAYTYRLQPITLRIEGIVQDPKNKTTDELLARRAQRSLTAALVYDLGVYQLGADFIAQSRRKDSDFSNAYNAGYGLLNLTAEWRVQRDWSLAGRFENVFDQNYALANGYNTAGRSLMIEARYRPAS